MALRAMRINNCDFKKSDPFGFMGNTTVLLFFHVVFKNVHLAQTAYSKNLYIRNLSSEVGFLIGSQKLIQKLEFSEDES